MSFATNGMRQGTPRVMATASLDQAMAFSNCNVIDYKQGLNFGMDVAPTMPGVPTVTVDGDMESLYSLNLDRTGHTVDMQISHAKEPEYRQSDSVDISELAGKISREMVQNESQERCPDGAANRESETRHVQHAVEDGHFSDIREPCTGEPAEGENRVSSAPFPQ